MLMLMDKCVFLKQDEYYMSCLIWDSSYEKDNIILCENGISITL